MKKKRTEQRRATAVPRQVIHTVWLRTTTSRRGRKVCQTPVPAGAIVHPIPQEWVWVEWRDEKTGSSHRGWIPVAALGGTADFGAKDQAEQRLQMARMIVNFEARRDSKHRILVYHLPENDGGGTYEVAGINQRYHPAMAARLRRMIEEGRPEEAEAVAVEYVAKYTDVAGKWSGCLPVQCYLRDCIFNRGPAGAAKILQVALSVRVDGKVGPVTRAALRKAERDVGGLLIALRQARETYELQIAGRRKTLWKGLVNRWDRSLAEAQSMI